MRDYKVVSSPDLSSLLIFCQMLALRHKTTDSPTELSAIEVHRW